MPSACLHVSHFGFASFIVASVFPVLFFRALGPPPCLAFPQAFLIKAMKGIPVFTESTLDMTLCHLPKADCLELPSKALPYSAKSGGWVPLAVWDVRVLD